jgi:hypothetical protein
MYHKTNHLADMDRGFIESSAFDRDAIIALATDPHWSDEARVRSIALTVAVDQGHAAAAVRAQQPPCCEVTGRSVEHDRPGGRRRGRLGRGRALLQEISKAARQVVRPISHPPRRGKS